MFELAMLAVVKEEQTVLKVGWGEVNEANTVMDYKESEDAVPYPLSAGALRSLEGKEKKKKNSSSLSLFLPRSVFLRSPLIRHRVLSPHLFLFVRFGVDRLSQTSQ